MSDIRGFFAPRSGKKRPAQPVETTSPSAKKAKAAVESAAAEDASSASTANEEVVVEDQAARVARNREAALAKLGAADDPVGLIEAMATAHVSWRDALAGETAKPYFARLMAYLRGEYERHTVFPPAKEVLAALEMCPLEGVKVVVLGQDPYHGPGQAHGLAFSVNRGVPLPPSLRNIYKELESDIGVKRPGHGCLAGWAKQGVLLLNTCLTVRSRNANSHANRGWESYTDAIIRAVSRLREGVVFILWGKPAQKKAALINSGKHFLIKSTHPSPLSASRAAKDCPAFLGSRCFSKANQILAEHGEAEIAWSDL
uniref:Uracil-DNA glycosylase n=1 Tax=Pinguiococcus pyrenoidosus TaxID=172671 RepID=A0A7R9UG84_9STRA|mmetsp:Transcript_7134/g.27317  ORF Transcript_7134/g.27317 Transcript_7134/m.27317 type:complete len:314 (+) Transcript_7134:110-1051(+)